MMKLHLVGGFLGSGKTTAIIAASRQLMTRGQRVGVVTNDQGRYLVDTAFMQSGNIPAVEVGGGCFCCNYDDLDARLQDLADHARPDVIFAESVGSCADLVATVVRPLQAYRVGDIEPQSLSVFADSRLLLRYLQGDELPFSEGVVYIFEQQLAEAGLVILNKADLLRPAARTRLLALARETYPDKVLRLQNSLNDDDITAWLAALQTSHAPDQILDIDYQRYGAGEADLAWLDEDWQIAGLGERGQEILAHLIEAVIAAILDRDWPVGHLKFFVQADAATAKVSLTGVTEARETVDLPPLPGDKAILRVNARVQCAADALQSVVETTLKTVAKTEACHLVREGAAAFHPAFPKPTHRMV